MPDERTIRAFMIVSEHEQFRKANVILMSEQFPDLIKQEAVYPKYQKIPFLDKIIQKSRERAGRALNEGEIGVLFSNRCIWQRICKLAKNDNEHFLIMESDSAVNNLELLKEKAQSIAEGYDLFFFGGWLGNIILKRSTIKELDEQYTFGEPYIKSICSGYGYSLNRKAARYLLKCTAKVKYPVDEFKKYIKPGVLKIGAVLPELISVLPTPSTIKHTTKNSFLHSIKMQLVFFRNRLVAYFS